MYYLFIKEKGFKIDLKRNTEEINNDIFIPNNSFIFIEVKSHFPKEIKDEEHNNLENIIKMMFIKLYYFINLYSKILKEEIKSIKIILFYSQNRLTNFKETIYKYIEKYKNYSKLENYELYFDIVYIIPSIEIFLLKDVNQKISKMEEKNKNIDEKIENLKESNERIQNIFNEDIKQLKEPNIQALKKFNDKIDQLKESNIIYQKIFNEEINKLKKEKELVNKKLKRLIEENEQQQKKLKADIEILKKEQKLLKLPIGNFTNNANEIQPIKSKIENNDNKIQNSNLNNSEDVLSEEEIFTKIENTCKKLLKDKNFSLIKFQRNHTSGKASSMTKAFHKALKQLTYKERKSFFDFYNFIPCMTTCNDLLENA